MLVFASLLAAIIPMLIYLILIWQFDKYDREPFKLVLRNYLWGAIGAIVLAIIGSTFLTGFFSIFISNSEILDKIGAIIVAPFVEEITKGIFLLVTLTSKKFDNMTDGIVYGGAIGLGFGMTENFLYFISYGTTLTDWLIIVIVRTLFSAVMHCVATASLGAFLGYSKFLNRPYKLFLPLVGLALAMFIHFAWNLSVSFESTAMLGFFFMFITVIIFIAVFTASVLREKKIIFNELMEEVKVGLIPYEHLVILSSPRRSNSGWVNETIRKPYVNAATTLAFRKMQWKNSTGSSRLFYENEVHNYRIFIQNLLINSNR
ncbi:MAG: PrsW family intramembrane metalloprotease [Ignavibacteriaceae bacterium]|nr:PrsW family intramembrane metalloprotease [Ignavibacteriaceae bacterium]